jgi:YD repeat-containing protein
VQNRYEYDVFGNLRKVSEGEFFKPISDLPQPLQGRGEEQGRGYGIETKYNYNTLGQLTKITDANSNERNIEYDLAGRRTSIEDLHAL